MPTETNRPRREVISGPIRPGLPFSTALVYGDLVFVSGLIGRDPATGEIALGDVKAQTTQTLKNIQHQLELAGTSLEKALKVTGRNHLCVRPWAWLPCLKPRRW